MNIYILKVYKLNNEFGTFLFSGIPLAWETLKKQRRFGIVSDITGPQYIELPVINGTVATPNNFIG